MRVLPWFVLLAFVPGALAEEAADDERDFHRRVDAAITKGAAWLATRQADDGHWKSGYDAQFAGGTTALSLLALLESEFNRHDPVVERGLKAMYASPLDKVYSAAIAMMVVEAYRVPPGERKARREGVAFEDTVRKLSDAEKELMRAKLALIVNGREHNAWGYPGKPQNAGPGWPGDLSNTQYALLGMKAAARCGFESDERVYLDILRILLDAQEQEGEKVKLMVDRKVTKDGYGDEIIRPATVRGWRYKWRVVVKSGRSTQAFNVTEDDKPSGSMTCAGISCLAIIHSEMHRKPKYRSKMKDVRDAIDSGFAWLDANWSVEDNPGGKIEWHYYYLYGLERAGMLTDRRWVGHHDWYREGAEYLLDQQGGAGGWSGDVLKTCFALLFLKRSTQPVTTTGIK